MSNSQLNKLKSEIKNGTEVTLKLWSNVVGDSNDENNFPYKLLSTNTKVLRVCKAFVNGSSFNIQSSKTQLHKAGPSGGFSDRLKTQAKIVLKPLQLTAAASATDAAIHKNFLELDVHVG